MLDGKRLTFGFEGVWQGTAILYDRDTGSIWMHFTGTCFAGPRAGRTLKMLATGTHTTWAAWRRDHPDTDVMAVDPRFASRYVERVAAKSGEGSLSTRFDRTITWRDPRLPLGELLLGVRVEGAARAYPLARLSATAGVVEETIALVPVTVWYETRARTAVAFERRQAGIFEHDTGSRFDADGRCVEGPLLGRRLVRLPSLLTEWYGWFVHHPETSIFGS